MVSTRRITRMRKEVPEVGSWYRVGGLDYLLKRSDVDTTMVRD
jgi:hypothetical protein